MGGYQAVDKSKERARIRSYLNGRVAVDFGVSKEKPKKVNGRDLKFDENGKLVK